MRPVITDEPTTRDWRGWADPVAWVAVAFWLACMLGLLLLSAPSGGAIAPSRDASDAAPCALSQVKGSVNGLYHSPDSRWYAQTRRARCFDTAADAERAGYREAGR